MRGWDPDSIRRRTRCTTRGRLVHLDQGEVAGREATQQRATGEGLGRDVAGIRRAAARGAFVVEADCCARTVLAAVGRGEHVGPAVAGRGVNQCAGTVSGATDQDHHRAALLVLPVVCFWTAGRVDVARTGISERAHRILVHPDIAPGFVAVGDGAEMNRRCEIGQSFGPVDLDDQFAAGDRREPEFTVLADVRRPIGSHHRSLSRVVDGHQAARLNSELVESEHGPECVLGRNA